MKRKILILGLSIVMMTADISMSVTALDDFSEETEAVFQDAENIEEFDETDADEISISDINIDDTEVEEGISEEETEEEQTFEEEILIEEIYEINPVLSDVEPYEYEIPELYGAIDTGSRIYYETTDECAQALRTAMINREVTINIYYIGDEYSEGYSKSLLDLAVAHDLLLENGSGDYLRYHYTSVDRRTFRGSSDQGVYYRFQYTFSYLSTGEQEDAVTSAMTSIMNGLDLSGDTVNDINQIYSYVTAHVAYDSSEHEAYSVHSAYAAVIEGKSVCQGYVTMLYRMFREAGINSRIVGGRAGSVNHAWIMVEIDGVWYYLDPTWDAGLASDDWQYYLIGSSQFLTNHIWVDQYQTDPLYATYVISEENYFSEEPVEPEEMFLESLYTNLLSRHSDPGGLAYWKNMLQTGTVDSLGVICGFLNSYEYAAKDLSQTYDLVKNLLADENFQQSADLTVRDETLLIVIRCYNYVLDRQPELSGLRYWCRKLDEENISYKDLFKGFLFSNERSSRTLSDEAFIDLVYRLILNRQPDAAELEQWEESFPGVADREVIFDQVTDTEEYHQLYNE